MLAQLVINYGEQTLSIQYAWIGYVIGSFVLLWSLIKIGKFALRKQEQYKLRKQEQQREHQMRQAEIKQQEGHRQLRDASFANFRRKKIEASLPGIWLTIYDAMKTADDPALARHVIQKLYPSCKSSRATEPLSASGAHYILSLSSGKDREAIARSISSHVAEWIKREHTGKERSCDKANYDDVQLGKDKYKDKYKNEYFNEKNSKYKYYKYDEYFNEKKNNVTAREDT